MGFAELMDDISSEYINKTVTYEYHPHLPILLVSLHPCRHGEVMKKLIKQYRDNNKSVSIDYYMFIFLNLFLQYYPILIMIKHLTYKNFMVCLPSFFTTSPTNMALLPLPSLLSNSLDRKPMPSRVYLLKYTPLILIR